MVLGMTKDAARVKEKSRAARRKGLRQVEYRGTRHRRFQGRRGEALEEEVRAEVRARRQRSIQIMARWLEQQELANSKEGTPRETVVEAEDRVGRSQDEVGDLEPAGPGQPVAEDSGRAGEAEKVDSVEPGQPLLSEFFRSRK